MCGRKIPDGQQLCPTCRNAVEWRQRQQQAQQSVHRKVHLEGVQNGAGANDRHDDLGEALAGGGRQDPDLYSGKADGQHQKHLHDLLEKEHIHLRHDSTSENAPAYPPERRGFDNRILTQTEPMSKKK